MASFFLSFLAVDFRLHFSSFSWKNSQIYLSTVIDDFNHVPGGVNVLYLDGHVSFVKYKVMAPASEGMASFQTGLQF